MVHLHKNDFGAEQKQGCGVNVIYLQKELKMSSLKCDDFM